MSNMTSGEMETDNKTIKKPDYVKSKVWKKASEESKTYIRDYKDFWILLCKIVHLHKEKNIIYGHMFFGKGIYVRPEHWIPEETVQELISLAKQNGKVECKCLMEG